jgi:F-type H+-transporting ATPase subunit epsilon
VDQLTYSSDVLIKVIFLFLNTKMSLQISILTPERSFWNGEAEEIILPTETGEMGVLKNHAPIITGLDVGAMLIRTKEQWNSVAIMGGFAVVKRNQITILANEAEASETIDSEEAKSAFEIAKANLEKAEGVKQKVEANFAFKRAKARFQVVKVVNKIK